MPGGGAVFTPLEEEEDGGGGVGFSEGIRYIIECEDSMGKSLQRKLDILFLGSAIATPCLRAPRKRRLPIRYWKMAPLLLPFCSPLTATTSAAPPWTLTAWRTATTPRRSRSAGRSRTREGLEQIAKYINDAIIPSCIVLNALRRTGWSPRRWSRSSAL